ncbi:MAG: SBBP repeat-containing protein, partial [Terriglobia bacterium]
VYYGNQHQLEYDFVVAPGADPNSIRLAMVEAGLVPARKGRPQGARLRINGNGDLVVETRGGPMRLYKPVAYQLGPDGKRRYVAAAYALLGKRTSVEDREAKMETRTSIVEDPESQMQNQKSKIGFKIGAYDGSRPLIIDPSLAYSTYLGGSAGDAATAIATDSSGDAYIVGATNSTNFPVSASPYQKTSGGSSDAFISEFDPTGGKLVFSTYLGGNGFDKANGVAVDSSGNIYVVGYTASPNFPTTKGVFQTKYGGNGNAFAAKLASGGSALTYSTYLGGSGGDFGLGMTIDSSGDVYITGSTKSTDFPVAQGFQNANGGGADAFVAELKPDGSAPVFSSYLGGSGADSGQAIALDAAGYIYVTGITYSSNFPTAAPLQAENAGGSDAFITKLKPSGAGIVYSTYLGGSDNDRAYAIAVDKGGEVYIAGDTFSTNFPTTPSPFQPANGGGDDAFVAKISAAGNALDYSTYLGGSAAEQAFGIALDGAGDAYVTGYTLSSNFPLQDPLDAIFGGGTCNTSACADAFVTEINPQGRGLVYSTYLGGSGADFGQAIIVDSGNAYVTGSTASSNFPAIGGAYQSAFAGTSSAGNAFVSKVSPANAPALSISPQTIDFGDEGVGYPSPATVVTLANEGTQALDISGITASAQFGETNNCPPTLAAGGGSCTVNVTFTPTATAAANGTLTVHDNAPGSPQTVSLSGTGITAAPAVTFSPTTLTFASRVVGTTSPPQVVTVTNTGSAALTISKVAVSGAFTETNNCVTTLKPAASCRASVTYAPTETTSSGTTNTNVGALSVTDNATSSPQSVSVSGTAVANFSLTATKTNVQIQEGVTSATFTVSVVGPAGFTKSITLGCLSGATCSYNPATITPGKTSTLTVSGLSGTTANPFDFTATGTNGNVEADLALVISFEDFSLSGSPPLQTVNAGQAATYTITLTPTSGFNQPVNLSCPSPINKSTCTFSPASLTPNGSTPLTSTLTVTTTAPTSTGSLWIRRLTLPPGSGSRILMWALVGLLLILVAGIPAASRRVRRGWLLFGLVVLMALAAGSCNLYNYGFVGGSPVPNGTAPGVYTLQISGATKPASGSTNTAVNRSTAVNLGVN